MADVGASVKFDPSDPQSYPSCEVLRKLESLFCKRWQHTFGDGRSSERIAEDLHRRVMEENFRRHKPELYHIEVGRSYREDGLT